MEKRSSLASAFLSQVNQNQRNDGRRSYNDESESAYSQSQSGYSRTEYQSSMMRTKGGPSRYGDDRSERS